MKVLDEEEISIPDVKQVLEARKKERDMVYEQKICLEYLEKIPKLTPAKYKALLEELSKIAILKPRHITLITNMLPDTDEEVEALFLKERTALKKEEIKQIADIVKKL